MLVECRLPSDEQKTPTVVNSMVEFFSLLLSRFYLKMGENQEPELPMDHENFSFFNLTMQPPVFY